jgi:uncharacterized repeat protein (TIGR01451 family)
MSSSTVQVGGTNKPVTFVSSAQLQISVSAADSATAGSLQVTVTNPTPGGGASNAVAFSINNPVPAITSVSPNTAIAGQAPTAVSVTGTGFVSSSIVSVNGTPRTTTYVSATRLDVLLTVSDFMTAGSVQITVANPSPGGGTSPASPIAVSNPAPELSSVSPSTIPTGSPDTVVDIAGSGFVRASVVQINGSARATQFVSTTELRATLLYTDFQAGYVAKITVVNSAPGGGVSGSVDLSVGNAVPGSITLIPSSIPAGFNLTYITIKGTGFTGGTVVYWNGVQHYPWVIDANTLRLFLLPTDVATPGNVEVTVYNPPPGGGTSLPAIFKITPMGVTSVFPTTFYVGSPTVQASIYGGGFAQGAVAQWNGNPLLTAFDNSAHLTATVPAENLSAIGNANLTVVNPDNSASDPVLITIAPNPVPVLNYLNPNSAPVGSKSISIGLSGSGFTDASVVKWNGVPIPSMHSTGGSDGYLGAVISPSLLQKFGTFNITVENPGPGGGGVSSPLPFSTYLALPTNDLVYSSWSQRLYASVPSTAGSLGNNVAEIDPLTGNVTNYVFVGSEPRKLALSSDGKTLWVGLDGASAVRKVDLTTMTAGLQFSVGPPSMYTAISATDLAVMPGSPNTVAVSTSAGIAIYDSGIARANSYPNSGYFAFNYAGDKLYLLNYNYAVLNIDSTGVSSYTQNNTASYGSNPVRYDNGRVYTSSGTVLNADTGSLLATFYQSQSQVAFGPVAPDSPNGKVFILFTNYGNGGQILTFDSNTYVATGALNVMGVSDSYYAQSLLRWGQNGLAFRTPTQVYILQSDLIKDMSATPADVGVSVTANSAAGTGSVFTYTATVTNYGPNSADGVTFFDALPEGVTPVSASAPQGVCSSGMVIRCNLGSIASGANVQVTLKVTPLVAGTFSDSMSVSAIQPDPLMTNNMAAASVAITGSTYNPAPAIVLITPSALKAGGASFTLQVAGSAFTSMDTVRWNNVDLPTTFIDENTLSATVDAANIGSLGYAWVSVFSPAPGGGVSASLPFTTYNVIDLDANSIIFEPFSRKIYASVPSTATQVTGNSIVSIDPQTGAISPPVNVGSQPHPLALSDDGNYLFVGLDGNNSLTRFNLLSNAPDLNAVLGTTGYNDTLTVRTVAVAPGNSNLVAIDTSAWTGIGLFDISGTTLTRRANLTGPYSGSDVVFADSTHVYAQDSQFRRYTVGSNGLVLQDAWTLNGVGNGPPSFRLSNGIVFGSIGAVVDPSTTPPNVLGRFSASGIMAADGWLGRAFFTGCTSYCPSSNSISAYDQSTYRLTSTLPFTAPGSLQDLIRWGKDGLAFRTSTDFWGNGTGQIYLLRGPFVLPQLGVANSIATATSASPSSTTAGAGNLYVTITGSGFVPGAVARWNGAERTTFFVNSSHLKVAIPASDVSAAGTGSLTVLNPGAASASTAVAFTIN